MQYGKKKQIVSIIVLQPITDSGTALSKIFKIPNASFLIHGFALY